jgi:hypothetical protein
MLSFAELVTSVGRQTDRAFGHRASPADRKDILPAGACRCSGAGRLFARVGMLPVTGVLSSAVAPAREHGAPDHGEPRDQPGHRSRAPAIYTNWRRAADGQWRKGELPELWDGQAARRIVKIFLKTR